MLIKVLGALDIVGGFILLLGSEISSIPSLFVFLGILFILKSAIGRWKEFGSWVDLLTGIFFLISIFLNVEIINLILGILLIQKGLVSFM